MDGSLHLSFRCPNDEAIRRASNLRVTFKVGRGTFRRVGKTTDSIVKELDALGVSYRFSGVMRAVLGLPELLQVKWAP